MTWSPVDGTEEHGVLADEPPGSGEPKRSPHEGGPQGIVFRHLND